MQKSDVAWLIVRIIGVCFILYAVKNLLVVFENLMMVSTAKVGETLLSQGSGLIGGWIIEAVISFVVGIYFLKSGRFLFNLINDESD